MWPSTTEFCAAIQNPRICFLDANLKSGTPAVDRLGLPFVASGQFAAVFKLEPKTRGKAQAIRCFTRELGDRARRYRAINTHLDACASIQGISTLAEYEYDAQGILVGSRKYPLLVMEWIEGNTLDVTVRMNLGNAEVLNRFASEWVQTVNVLRTAKIAHGDLQHGNIIVQPDSKLRLVDLDGLFVPEMGGLKACEIGHRDYQHPARSLDHFGLELDNFSALVIYVSLRALARRPQLWDEFHDEGLILKQKDFKEPANSACFKAIRRADPQLAPVVDALEAACRGPINSVPFLGALIQAPPKSKLPDWMVSPVAGKTQTVSRIAGNNGAPPPPPRTIPPTPAIPPTCPPHTGTPPASSPIPRPTQFAMARFLGGSLAALWLYTALADKLGSDWTFLYFGIAATIVLGFSFKEGPKTLPVRNTSGTPPSQTPPYQPRPLPPNLPTQRPGVPPVRRPWPAPPSRTTAPGRTGPFVASSMSRIYHHPHCKWGRKVSGRNMVRFANSADADAQGFRSCGVCRP